MKHAATLQAILANDPRRRDVLAAIRSLGLPDCWVGAGFIRNAVWDYLHDRPPSRHAGDVDIIWFCSERARPEDDREVEAALRALEPAVDWSVKNQARMHVRNGDAPYASAIEAIGHWPETATAVAARRFVRDRGAVRPRRSVRSSPAAHAKLCRREAPALSRSNQVQTVAHDLAAAADRELMFSLETCCAAPARSRPLAKVVAVSGR
jgi:hypothetical protein